LRLKPPVFRPIHNSQLFTSSMRFFACFALTVSQCTSSARKAVSQAASVDSIEEAWANHKNSVATKDIDKMMEGYTEQSQIQMWMEPSGKYWIVSGLDEIRKFNRLGFLDSGRSPNQLSEITDDRQTWTFWNQPEKIETGTDTFIYDDNFKIIRQYIYTAAYPVEAEVPQLSWSPIGVFRHFKPIWQYIFPPSPPIGVFRHPTPGNGPTQHVWNTHAAAWRSHNLEDILKDYTEASIMRVFSGGHGPIEFKGVAGVRRAFTGALAALAGVTDYEDMLEEVDENYQVVD